MSQHAVSTDALAADLNEYGYAVFRTEPTAEAITEFARSIGVVLGARSMAVKSVAGMGEAGRLERHTESIYDPEDILLKSFALGCMVASTRGGATCLYDARSAAERVLKEAPALADVKVLYRTLTYPGQEAVHPLIYDHPEHGRVLRYRSESPLNTIIDGLPSHMTEEDFYRTVGEAVDSSLVVAHEWTPGEVLVVNNLTMIHDRQPYEGRREMLRFRYDDPHVQTMML